MPNPGEVGADRIDHGGLLANKEMTRAMEHEATVVRVSWSPRNACSAANFHTQ